MNPCPYCAAEPPEGARFCPECGTALVPTRAGATERRVVTTLFCDLVDFTALCERTDPEDVDELLRSYYGYARGQIERFGGTVEKYVGDAVVGVFGIPTAHEDDAERAVRAGWALTQDIGEVRSAAASRLAVRVGVNTGPALVRLDVDPATGAGCLVGDAVNTAARLETLAPPGGVIVGETTRSLAPHVADYDALPPSLLKGKREPVRPWLLRELTARTGLDPRQRFSTPLVGREVELAVMSGLFDKVCASSRPHAMLVTGEAGIGKSRLVHEFGHALDERPGLLCVWRQGHCPAYGDGLGFWPLREIVCSQAGIRQADGAPDIERKLADVISDGGHDEWVGDLLRPLVGLPGPKSDRDESFAAWLRFLEGIARVRPAVLVMEDLHWASESLLSFLGYLVREAADVPLLLVGTARPEFLAEADLAAFPEMVHVDLTALTQDETARLVDSQPGMRELEGVRDIVVDRCGGNPLYIEEVVRYTAERAALGEEVHPGIGLGVLDGIPDSLLALIAARLDALPAVEKTAVADAAVVGHAFWPGALAALNGGDLARVEAVLRRLEERQFVHRQSTSSLSTQVEFLFSHALIRDVAYEQLPRSVRAQKHAALVDWLLAETGDRGAGVTEVLAYHAASAVELARAAGLIELAHTMQEPAARSLLAAGDQALPLDVAGAERYYSRALEYFPPDSDERPTALAAWGEAIAQSGELSKAVELLKEAAEGALRHGRTAIAALWMSRQATMLRLLADPRADALYAEALALVEPCDDSPEKAAVLAAWAMRCASAYMGEEAVAAADRALEVSSRLGLPESVHALGWKGMARCDLGDRGGLDDLQRAIEQGRDRGLGREVSAMYYNLSDVTLIHCGVAAGSAVAEEGVEFARRRGDLMSLAFLEAIQAGHLVSAGRWDEALALAEDVGPRLEATGQTLDLGSLLVHVAYVQAQRGLGTPVPELVHGRPPTEQADIRISDLCFAAAIEVSAGNAAEARADLSEAAELRAGLGCPLQTGLALAVGVEAAWLAGAPELAALLATGLPESRAIDACIKTMLEAFVTERDGSAEEAAVAWSAAALGWQEFSAPYQTAKALLGRGRCLLAAGRHATAREPLAQALTMFSELRAAPLEGETRRLLAEATAAVRPSSAT
jgi:class 3 adenylate cyclase/tetratricopeptide (TPR) repeat protein